jgi:hypothetical protein
MVKSSSVGKIPFVSSILNNLDIIFALLTHFREERFGSIPTKHRWLFAKWGLTSGGQRISPAFKRR